MREKGNTDGTKKPIEAFEEARTMDGVNVCDTTSQVELYRRSTLEEVRSWKQIESNKNKALD
jgi:hypothetical protein